MIRNTSYTVLGNVSVLKVFFVVSRFELHYTRLGGPQSLADVVHSLLNAVASVYPSEANTDQAQEQQHCNR